MEVTGQPKTATVLSRERTLVPTQQEGRQAPERVWAFRRR